jgi:hypothetical protein
MDARLIGFMLGFAFAASAFAFDHSHDAWDTLLKKYVVVKAPGSMSALNYAGMAKDRGALKAYLESVSAVKELEFNAWPKAQRMAFLINAYNAFAVEKILTRYPDIQSIWDFGKIFGNPFKDRFFALFGRDFSLDAIEHETLRKPGGYDEPRVHFAVNCASVGCPMLREEAYVPERMEQQLEAQTQRFLRDAGRNRYNPSTGRLEVSRIFDWFKDDFHPRERFFARYAELLTDDSRQQQLIIEGKAPLAFLEYDWTLNDSR